jgi:hypothetical protein
VTTPSTATEIAELSAKLFGGTLLANNRRGTMSVSPTARGGLCDMRLSSLLFYRLLNELGSEVVQQSNGGWFVHTVGQVDELYGNGWKCPNEAAMCALAFIDYQPEWSKEMQSMYGSVRQ